MNRLRSVLAVAVRKKWMLVHFAVVFLILGFYWSRIDSAKFRSTYNDAMQYVVLGFNLARYDVFSMYPEHPNPRREREPSNYRPPGFPVVVATAFRVDPTLRGLTEKQAFSRSPRTLRNLFYLQHIFRLLAALLTMTMVIRLTGSMVLGWMSLLLVAYTSLLNDYVNYMLSETFITLLVMMVASALYVVAKSPGPRQFVVAGIALGFLALSRAHFYYFVPIPLILFAWLAWREPENRKRIGIGSVLFVSCVMLLVGPWMIRNYRQFGRFMLARRGGHLLVIRSNMNMLRSDEYWASFWYWTPPGRLRQYLQSRVDTRAAGRFQWRNPRGFQQVSRKLRQQMNRKYGPTVADQKQKSIGMRKILQHPARHLALCFPLAYRGIMVSNPAFSFFLFLSFFAMIIHILRQRDMPLLFLFSIVVYNFVFAVALTHSEARYNVTMLPLLIMATFLFWQMIARTLFQYCRLKTATWSLS